MLYLFILFSLFFLGGVGGRRIFFCPVIMPPYLKDLFLRFSFFHWPFFPISLFFVFFTFSFHYSNVYQFIGSSFIIYHYLCSLLMSIFQVVSINGVTLFILTMLIYLYFWFPYLWCRVLIHFTLTAVIRFHCFISWCVFISFHSPCPFSILFFSFLQLSSIYGFTSELFCSECLFIFVFFFVVILGFFFYF